ncbi:SusD/RagB family nutrient-binding outer membrane lipoprotein [Neolewinella litorea]|uniref:SusD/RagB family nutrient-binding outer membrane lipoprotein n=1 Tax=Neolewinella litorea TaxID=2562452 RepID=A0A4S4NK86_9BACT|nr:SusD/RagB family nutrient-binding outer membrane lipoprotein [Neolewinella litorea]THH40264.1 SusD/RagB family nutrient-binding outer membrane lipoprotein [Neolewinella litorea]
MNLFKKCLLVVSVLSVAACTDLDELLVNPNGVSPDQADASSLYNSIQLTFNDVQNDPYFFAAGLARMDAETGGFTYTATHQPTEFDGMWEAFYAGFLPDADAFIALAEPLGQDAAAASVKIMKAYGYMQFADLFGDVPFDEAGQGNSENQITNPTRTPGAEVYASANALLDEAIAQLEGADDFELAFDNFYGGSAEDWATLARTLKLRNAVTTRLVGGGSAVQSIVDAGDIIDENNENFEWHYGSNRNNPNNRHPFYNNSYEDDDGVYQSNWYMWLMAESKGFIDPRTRYYFFRQDKNIFPDAVEDDPNAFDCIFTAVPNPDVIPPWYEAVSEDMPYCLGSYSLGYFGRDHLNGSGIPPDGQYRTVFGLYPAGGRYDDGQTNETVQNGGTDGALGAGIEPIWQASFTHFILAEAALTGNYDGDAGELLKEAIQLSFDRVTSFESLVDGGTVIATTPVTVTIADTYAGDESVEEYIEYVMEEYEDADDTGKLAIVAREYLIALYGNGLEAYNLYRRTCLPMDVQPGIDPNPGSFIRSALYPSVHINRNLNATQKASFTEPVFWDTNDASCNY